MRAPDLISHFVANPFLRSHVSTITLIVHRRGGLHPADIVRPRRHRPQDDAGPPRVHAAGEAVRDHDPERLRGLAPSEVLLHRETLVGGVPAVVLHPGHISGPGWPVITPAGNLDPAAWTSLATGQPLALPDHGLGVLHHVHADDVAQAFERALTRPAAIGASFHVVADQAMILRGLATGVARWFGREPQRPFFAWPR